MSSIVSQEWLLERLDHADIVIVDCRFTLGQPEAGKEGYQQGHIPGAFYMDLEKDLSGAIKAHGGRHPLPDLGGFSLLVGSLGIDASKKVVAYDDQGGAMASRLWWMLQFLGHTEGYVLGKGFSAWKAAGLPVTAEVPAAAPRTFSPKVQRHMLASYDEVKDKVERKGTVLVDSREARRYQGLEEAIDPVAGHIPGAKNYFWKEVLDGEGAWKSPEEHKAHFEELQAADEIIVYCGSGVTACPNVLALKQAGFANVKLYSGSWSDWVSYAENPIATGEE
ncbi:sulfurtransferase [Paenibacillus eucommiae]|uniref:Thiosulfate/3-mercaptopyruvate sulfurtransferase n=1 Tax=Paenibacillus eucommiae TaxID=1355755 RepID=A0ABS4J4U1_9BACL|nr:sulfurtransferase [Paenibacillus eucommiae]MBP1994853.1 thiosulfate/3-mercaptopyruvate sulfurtransferase [Paenibacillus eucommiae]